MPKPNASHAPDPAVSNSSHDPSYDPSASREAAMVDIPAPPDTLAAMKNADPVSSIGSGNDHAGTTTDAVKRGMKGY
jgi:hypothetical protein